MNLHTRNFHGNMLLLSIVVIGLIVFVLIIGFGINLLMFAQKKAKGQADDMALASASSLNASDFTGQMNDLVRRSRELVFVSRTTHHHAVADYKHLEPLARQLLEEARNSAYIVELERKRLVQHNLRQLDASVGKFTSSDGSASTLSLPWMKTYAPQLTGLEVGYIDGVPSNVKATDGVPELSKFDLAQRYIQKESGLYLGNINAKLPPPDSDLDFKIASLPAAVEKTVAPARLTSPSVFVSTCQLVVKGRKTGSLPDQLPSAVKMNLLIKITGAQEGERHDLALSAVAASNGAMPSP